jgi:hypothetical protein
MEGERESLRESAQRILSSDERLTDQVDLLRGLAGQDESRATPEHVRDRVGAPESVGADSTLALETIVNRVGRPVPEVADDDYKIAGAGAAIWDGPHFPLPEERARDRIPGPGSASGVTGSTSPGPGRMESVTNGDLGHDAWSSI